MSSLQSYTRTQVRKYYIIAMLSIVAARLLRGLKTFLKALAEKQLLVMMREDH